MVCIILCKKKCELLKCLLSGKSLQRNFNLIFALRSTKGSPALKIAAGLSTVCGGSVAATIIAYHYSSEFRRLVDVNLPAIEPLLGVIDSYLNSFGNTQLPGKQQENVQEFSSASGPLDLSLPAAEKVRRVSDVM